MNATTMPRLTTPRETCAAALAMLICGAGPNEAQAVLEQNEAKVERMASESGTTHTVRLTFGPRRHYQGVAGSCTDAFMGALREALGLDPARQQP